MIIEDPKKLAKECAKCESMSYGKIIARELLEELSRKPGGVGLAANQIGYNTRVCVIKVNKPIILINPVISGKFGKSFYQEGCLSFPGSYIMTERWTDIVVDADNHSKSLYFNFEKDALECVCVQHEIDHLNGITMFDRQVNMEIFRG